ncbi:C-terminal novel E3 ligase, LRR-interacting [Pseudomonas agarici]|nr:C-terminal novel E3 ligase, LRR-interacting [Pseudomonas agarici]
MPVPAGHPQRCFSLSLLRIPLIDILIVRTDDHARSWVVYIPGDPFHPVRQYPSRAAFEDHLREKLRTLDYLKFFVRFIPQRERARFIDRLYARLDPKRWNGYFYQPTPDPRANLDLAGELIGSYLFRQRYQQKVETFFDDALFIAVPTADKDRQSLTAHLQHYLNIALNVLNVAAFIVPGLGEMMLGVIAVQLGNSIFHTIDSFAVGDKQHAWAYLTGVLQNVALIAALGAAGASAAAAENAAIASASFADGLRPVRLPNGDIRLFNPDIAPFEHKIVLPRTLEPDATGLYHHQGRTYLPIDDKYYELKPDPSSWRYRARHPHNPDAYTPTFRHNGSGGWAHEFEQPLAWDDLHAFSRLGSDAAALDASSARRVMHISAINGDVLRQLHVNHMPPPALLQDTLLRFRLDQDIRRLASRLRSGEALGYSRDELHMTLQLLTHRPVWPASKVLRLLDRQKATLTEYPPNLDPRVTRIDATWDDLRTHDLLRTVLTRLSEREIRTLLDEEFGQGPISLEARTAQLRRILAREAVQRRESLFASHYEYRTHSVDPSPAVAVIQRDFSSLPSLVARELVSQANNVELQRLAAGTVPLRLAEEARLYVQNIRLARAYEQVYLDSISQAEAYRVVLPMLERLPGWSSGVRIEIRDGAFNGPLLDSIGPKQAASRKVVIREGDRYAARDALDQELHGPDDLYAALLHALPDAERAALGLPHVGQGARFRQALLDLPPLPRETLRQRLGMPPIRPDFISPMRLANDQLAYGLSGRGAGRAVRSFEFNRLAQALYPTLRLSEVETLHGLRDMSLGAGIEKLRKLELEYATLEDELDAWVGDPQTSVDARGRLRLALQIRRCWRHETDLATDASGLPIGGRQLSLTGYPLENLPRLSANFNHVTEMHLRGLALLPSAELDSFLDTFPRLQRLDMSRNILTRLPSALARLTTLKHLDLKANQIVITPVTGAPLTHLTQLEVLILENNSTLSMLPDLSPLTRLSHLHLRNTGLRQWPRGYEQLPGLRTLDLSDNRISSIPDEVFAVDEQRQRLNRAINLEGNPIPPALRQRVESYRQQTGLDLGLDVLVESDDPSEWSGSSRPQSRASSRHSRWGTPSPVPRDSTPWLEGLTRSEQQARRDLWLRLASDDIEDSEAFFKVLEDLKYSADYHSLEHRLQLSERVWRMVRAASENTELREGLFNRANAPEPDACEDGITVVFSDMGLDVLLYEARSLPLEAREGPLLQLARGKSRLDQVNRQARRLIDTRKASGLTPDEAEVYLAFRIGLAQRLELPWQARKMNHADIAGVKSETLDEAYQAILEQEAQPGEMSRSLAKQPFWKDYLEKRFTEEPLKASREQRDNMIGALDDLLSAQREWFGGKALDTEQKTELAATIRQSARTLGLTETEVFASALTDSTYLSLSADIARQYTDTLEQLTEQRLQRWIAQEPAQTSAGR